jgi:hypothetical protein
VPLLWLQRRFELSSRRGRDLALSKVQYSQLESGVPMRKVWVLARLECLRSLACRRRTWRCSGPACLGFGRASCFDHAVAARSLRTEPPPAENRQLRELMTRVFSGFLDWSRRSESPHNPKVEGSNPSPATMKPKELGELAQLPFPLGRAKVGRFLTSASQRPRSQRALEADRRRFDPGRPDHRINHREIRTSSRRLEGRKGDLPKDPREAASKSPVKVVSDFCDGPTKARNRPSSKD